VADDGGDDDGGMTAGGVDPQMAEARAAAALGRAL